MKPARILATLAALSLSLWAIWKAGYEMGRVHQPDWFEESLKIAGKLHDGRSCALTQAEQDSGWRINPENGRRQYLWLWNSGAPVDPPTTSLTTKPKEG